VFLVVNESLVLIPKTSFIQARDSSVQVPLSSKISISSLVRKSILGRSASFIPLLFHFKYSLFTTVSSFAATTSAGLLKSLRSTKVFNLQKALILSKTGWVHHTSSPITRVYSSLAIFKTSCFHGSPNYFAAPRNDVTALVLVKYTISCCGSIFTGKPKSVFSKDALRRNEVRSGEFEVLILDGEGMLISNS
jgi:hypothetical protein